MSNWAYTDAGFVLCSELSLELTNRSFSYGDGLFESIRIANGMALFLDKHIARLQAGMKICGLENDLISESKLLEISSELIRRNKLQGGRLKIQVYRTDGGYYKPATDDARLIVSTELLANPTFIWNNKGLQTGLYAGIKKPINLLSGLKSNSALLYVLAAREARIKAWDEIFILNEFGNLCEGSSSSIFLIDNAGTVHTPALSQGLLPGIMRQNIIELMQSNGMVCVEREIRPEELLEVRELFITNAIHGIRWVVSYNDKRYFNNIGKSVFRLLQEQVLQTASI